MSNQTRLWEKGEAVDEVMHRLTVGNDPETDRALLRWDCIGSAAHARMLGSIGILASHEVSLLLRNLKDLCAEADRGELLIPPALEDAHTAIENRLIALAGEVGEKIHTGRSRNDQVILAVRLLMRSEAVKWMRDLLAIASLFGERFEEFKEVPMPGYTHMQPAMPATVGMWLHAFMEGALELVREGFAVLDSLDSNPLGAAAGFGSSLPLDREYVAALLHFSRVQRSFIDVQNSRGRLEERFVFWGAQIASLFEKFAFDVVLYCTREYGFFSLPAKLTTGSSIMPQKRNPDIAELLRGRAGRVRGALSEMSWVSGKLPSNYHRDLQFTKEPLMRVVGEIPLVFASVRLIVEGLEVNRARLSSAMHPELYATYEAYRQVKEGVPFRTAYKETAIQVKSGEIDVKGLQGAFEQVVSDVVVGKAAGDRELISLMEQVTKIESSLQTLESAIFSPA